MNASASFNPPGGFSASLTRLGVWVEGVSFPFQSAGRIFGFAKYRALYDTSVYRAFQSAGRIFGFAKSRWRATWPRCCYVSIRRADFRLR